MSKIFKIVLVLLIAASLVSAAIAVIGFMGKEREYMKRLVVEDKLALTLKDKRNIEKELEAAKSAKDQAEAKISKIEDKIKDYSSQIEEAKKKSETIGSELDAKKTELSKVRIELENERKEKAAISKKLDALQADYEKVKKDVSALSSNKLELEKKITELQNKQAVNLDKIVVSSEDDNDAAPDSLIKSEKPVTQGSILVVNKEYSFIVIDMGQDRDIKKGMKFDVMDGPKLLGQAEIDKVYDTMSSATILPGGKISDMKKGNAIVESR